MNSAQAKEISIEKVLQKQGYFPSKDIENCNWYLSPFRAEKTPSFRLDLRLNRWFDHGEQKGGNVIDYVVYKFNFSVSLLPMLLRDEPHFKSLYKVSRLK